MCVYKYAHTHMNACAYVHPTLILNLNVAHNDRLWAYLSQYPCYVAHTLTHAMLHTLLPMLCCTHSCISFCVRDHSFAGKIKHSRSSLFDNESNRTYTHYQPHLSAYFPLQTLRTPASLNTMQPCISEHYAPLQL